jgi:hypothetical protein
MINHVAIDNVHYQQFQSQMEFTCSYICQDSNHTRISLMNCSLIFIIIMVSFLEVWAGAEGERESALHCTECKKTAQKVHMQAEFLIDWLHKSWKDYNLVAVPFVWHRHTVKLGLMFYVPATMCYNNAIDSRCWNNVLQQWPRVMGVA